MGFAILAGVLVAVAFAASPALAAGPPKFASLETFEIHATRASVNGFFLLDGSESPTGVNGSETQWRIEYATSEAGPWIIAGSGTSPPGPADNVERGGVELTHLTPRTSYVTRMVLENGTGNATETAQFTTTSVGAPEFLRPGCGSEGSFTFLQQESKYPPNMCGTLHVTFADFLAEFSAAGSETEYQFEYGLGENGPWTPVAGASGHVTVAEDHADVRAHVTGLSPETTYYVRVVAKNSVGTSSGVVTFPTFPAHPQADINGVNAVTAGSAHVLGGVNPNESETQWSIEDAAAATGPWTIVPGGEGTIPAAEGDTAFHPVAADLIGLSAARSYYVRLVARNAHGSVTSGIESFETSGPPVVTTFATHAFQGEVLDVLGTVEPHGFDAHYHFEYVTQEHFQTEGFANAAKTPELDAGGGGSDESEGKFTSMIVAQALADLQAGDTYHYRIVATNTAPGNPVNYGQDQTLTVPRQPAPPPTSCPNEAFRIGPSASLPDCRAYEQVTPVAKSAYNLFSHAGTVDELTPVDDGERVALKTLAQLGPNPGSESGAAAHGVGVGYVLSRTAEGWKLATVYPSEPGHTGYDAEIFSPDLAQVGVGSSNFTTFYEHAGGLGMLIGAPGGPYRTVADVSVDDGFVKSQEAPGSEFFGADASFSHVILSSIDHSLAPAAAASVEHAANLYDYSGGQLSLVNVTNAGSLASSCGAVLGYGKGIEGDFADNAVSGDGSMVFFTSPDPHPDASGASCNEPPQLYMRDGGVTTEISAPEPGWVDPGGPQPVIYRGASTDGSRVFFTTTAELTKDDEGIHDEELYEYDTQTAKLTRISHGASGMSAAGVDGAVAGHPVVISTDGSTVYFQATGQLTPEAPRNTPAGGANNLYRYDTATGAISYVATLGPAAVSRVVNEATPDGRFLLFESLGVLGADAPGGEQLYRYDSTNHSLTCVSCAEHTHGEVMMAEQTGAEVLTPDLVPRVRAISDDGSFVFFATTAALAPKDINEAEDVYEWHEGIVTLLSGGRSPHGSEFLGEAANGRDVFFSSNEQLAPSDTDDQGQAYDARIDGGFAPPPPAVAPCEGDACSTPFAPPSDLTPASSTFLGAGNLQGEAAPEVKSAPKAKAKAKAKKRRFKAKKRKRKSRKAGKRGSRAKRAVHSHHGGAK